MPAAVQFPNAPGGPPPRKKFTRAEVDRMTDAGVFAGQRYELIEGDLLNKMGQNPPHASAISLLIELLANIFGLRRLRAQLPIEVSGKDQEVSSPEPDIAVTSGTRADYLKRHPQGKELVLLVEVADSTLTHDCTTKRDLYARAGVPEYWVLDLSGNRLLVFRKPAQGVYAESLIFAESEMIGVPGSAARLPVSSMLAG